MSANGDSTPSTGKEIDPKNAQMLFALMKNFDGKVNFNAAASELGATNGEAVRKRFKRFLEKEEIALIVKGDMVGNGSGENAGTAGPSKVGAPKTPTKPKEPKTPKTPKTPATPKMGKTAKEPKSGAKKRKVAETVDDSAVEGEVGVKEESVMKQESDAMPGEKEVKTESQEGSESKEELVKGYDAAPIAIGQEAKSGFQAINAS